MSSAGSTEGRNRTEQHTDSTKLSISGRDQTYNALVSITTESVHYPSMPARHKNKEGQDRKREVEEAFT